MNLNKTTLAILQNFSTINTNLVIKPGKKISTMSSTKDIMAEYEGDDDFTKQVSIFNLSEMLGVISAFDKPNLDLDDKFLTIKEGKQKVKYVYADESLLTTPTKSITMPQAEIKFELSAGSLAKLQKMASILAVEDLAFVGDGKKIIARVYDSKNPTGNNFDIDLEVKSTEKFNVLFKVEKMKLFAGQDYDVEISIKKISRFSAKAMKLVVFVAVEASSTFE